MLAVMRQLRTGAPRVGKIHFPRLELGFIPLSLSAGGKPPEEQIRERLSQRPSVSLTVTTEMARQAAKVLPPTENAAVTEAAEITKWLATWIGKRRQRHVLEFYESLHRQEDDQPDALVWIYNLWCAASAPDSAGRQTEKERDEKERGRARARRRLWEVLSAALLADLRAEFNHVKLARGDPTTNCLLVLDNADTGSDGSRLGPGEFFLRALAANRSPDPSDPDPLVTVATRATWPEPDLGLPTTFASSAEMGCYADWAAADRDRPGAGAWYQVELADLTIDLTSALVTRLVNPSFFDSGELDTDLVYDLSAGHPGTAKAIAEKLNGAARDSDLRALSEYLVPGQHARPDNADCAESALWHLKPGWVQAEDLDGMAMCAATPRPRKGACEAAFRYLKLPVDAERYYDMLKRLMWADETDHALTVRPLPRLLLSRWLARSRERDLWRVHEGFATHYRGRLKGNDGKSPHEYLPDYHDLAVTSVPATSLLDVVRHLDRSLTDQPIKTWHAELLKITAAPNRLGMLGYGPDVFPRIAASAPPETPETGNRTADSEKAAAQASAERVRVLLPLTAALWLVHDRTFDPRRKLAGTVSRAYSELGKLLEKHGGAVADSLDVLYDESRYWRAQDKRWKGQW
jgi:hypothetical protein